MTWKSFLYHAACWPFQRYQRGVLAWVLAVVLAVNLTFTSLREGVDGHITCDFAGQWMHGRAFYRERCQDLYLVEAGKELLGEGFTGKHLDKQISDVLKKGPHRGLYDDGIGGALYPPTASILFSLLATFIPSTAHALAVVAYLLMIVGSGWMISRITHGRLQWGEATLLLLFFPNNFMGLMLGQNQALSLTILVGGWYCYHRRWPLIAGLVWGLFAFKPVFAVAMLLVPICLRNPRWFLGMAITGLLWVGATLPFTKGIDPWLRWLNVGKHAEQIYQVDANWIWMSRDLVGLSRRRMWEPDEFLEVMRYNIGTWRPGASWTILDETDKPIFYPRAWLLKRDDFDSSKHQRVYLERKEVPEEVTPKMLLGHLLLGTAGGQLLPAPVLLQCSTGCSFLKPKQYESVSPLAQTLIGYALLSSIAGVTVLLSWRKRMWDQPADGTAAVFLLTGCLLCVFHFMHYDLLSFGLPVLIMLAQWSFWSRSGRFCFLVWYVLWLIRTYAYYFGDGILEVPWDTYLLLVLWGWTGIVAWNSKSVASGGDHESIRRTELSSTIGEPKIHD